MLARTLYEGVVKALENFKIAHPEVEFNKLPEYGAAYFTL